MRILTCALLILLLGCSKSSSTDESSGSVLTDLSACQGPTSVTHSFVNWDTQAANDFNCVGMVSKMSCHHYVGTLSGNSEVVCQDLNVLDPHSVPIGCAFYTNGDREWLNGTEGDASAYDCGYQEGLRCFYFQNLNGAPNENIVCLDN